MQLRTLNTSDPTLNRIQDAVADALRQLPEPLKSWRIAEGPWPTPSSPACILIQHFESGQWATKSYVGTDGTLQGKLPAGSVGAAQLDPALKLTGGCAAIYGASVAQSIPNGVTTVVNFDSKIYDTDSAVTTGSAWKFTVPAGKGGLYDVKAALQYNLSAPGSGSLLECYVYKNGGAILHGTTVPWVTGVTQYITNDLTGLLVLAAGDYIDFRAFQNTGVAQPINNNGQLSSRLCINRVLGY